MAPKQRQQSQKLRRHNNNNLQPQQSITCFVVPASSPLFVPLLLLLLVVNLHLPFCASSPTSTVPPTTNRFLHFVVPTRANWWWTATAAEQQQQKTPRNKLFAVFERANNDNNDKQWQQSWQEVYDKHEWNRQLVLELFFGSQMDADGQQPAQQTKRQMPFTRLVNTEKWSFVLDEVPKCEMDKEEEEELLSGEEYNIQLEVELLSSNADPSLANAILVRAQNAVKYALPGPIGTTGMRVTFVRTNIPFPDANNDVPPLDERNSASWITCQINYHLEQKKTSRFQLPSTTPIPVPPETMAPISSNNSRPIISPLPSSLLLANNNNQAFRPAAAIPPVLISTKAATATKAQIPAASTTKTTIPIPIPIHEPIPPLLVSSPPPAFNADNDKKDEYGTTPKNWPYKRKRVKVPRRSTQAAKNFLSPNHYVPHQGRNWHQLQQQQQQQLLLHQWPTKLTWMAMSKKSSSSRESKYNNGYNDDVDERIRTTTATSYIDIIRDQKLYQEVQRSRTSEINSRWSYIFLVFMGCIAVMISMSAAFALIMFVLLQCRPDTKKKKKPKKGEGGEGGSTQF